jgi:hypothetical protein
VGGCSGFKPESPNQKPESGVEVMENGKLLTTVNCAGEMVNQLKGFAL